MSTIGYPWVLLKEALLLLLVVVGEVTSGEDETSWPAVPAQWEHRYHQDVDGDLQVREYLLEEVHPRTALLCPEGFAIAKLRMLLRLGEDILSRHPEEALDVPFAHWLVRPEDGVSSDEERGRSRCPTLRRCLGYQACLFRFGIEFCHMDPVPGQRKNLLVTLTCMRDERLMNALKEASAEPSLLQEVSRRVKMILHLTYTSKMEEGVEDLDSTEIRSREEDEEEVFHVSCPDLEEASEAGYRGSCHTRPPGPEDVNHELWSLLGRVPSPKCRAELQQIYCSFVYHPKGLCLPPFVLTPGQPNSAPPEALQLTHDSFPFVGRRPDPTRSQPQSALVPARIGFVILAHKDPPAVMQLLRLLYRQQHQYVIHVDRRREDTRKGISDLLKKVMPGATNVRILPPSRSFVASWGSFGIVRAELESLEELLRMGVWDHAVKLSGSDLPIRSADDLSAALAAQRGTSFVPLFGRRNVNMDADQGLVWDVWHGCDGYVYNVTRGGGQPSQEEIPIYTGSQWSILSRDLADYSVSRGVQSEVSKRWQFHIQTSIIPDESFFPTTAMNSPFANRSLSLGFHWLKKFEGRNAINLCRHMEDTDFCGQGPGPIKEEDLGDILKASHRYFFARKFHTKDPTHPTRTKVADHANYYRRLRPYLPGALLTQLAQLAFNHLGHSTQLGSGSTYPGAVRSFKVLPKLHLTNPCCSLPFERSFKSTQEFVYWIDFDLKDEEGDPVGGARALLSPRPLCDCYPDGHLRALRATTWPEDPESEQRSAMSTNMPLPHARPGVETVYAELWFHAGERSTTSACKVASVPTTGTPMAFSHLDLENVSADPLNIVAQLVDPRGNVRCEERKREVWDSEHIHTNGDGERVEFPSFFTLDCGALESGRWTLRVFQEGVEDPRLYEVPIVVLPRPEDLPDKQIDLLQGLWTVDQVGLLPLDDFGDAPEMPKRDPAPPVDRGKRRKEDIEKNELLKEPYHSRRRRDVDEVNLYDNDFTFNAREWFVCGGGLLTTMLTAVFTYHWVLLPGLFSVRITPRMRRSAVLVLSSILCQILACSLFCR